MECPCGLHAGLGMIYDPVSAAGASRFGQPRDMSPSPVSEIAPSNARARRPAAAAWLLTACVVAVALAGCGTRMPQPYTPPLQQGNVIEQESLSKLKPGMTRSQVRFLLGTPLVVDVFRNDRWDYVYFLRRQGQAPQQRRITVIFEGDLLARIEGDVVAGASTAPSAPPPAKAGVPGAAPAKSEPAKSEAPKSEAPDAGAPRADVSGAGAAEAGKSEAAPPQRGFFGRMRERIGL
jgi:outer membrane protein assembly factor BamE